MEQERLQMQEERELLSRQQDAMKEHAGPRELRTYPRIPLMGKEKAKKIGMVLKMIVIEREILDMNEVNMV